MISARTSIGATRARAVAWTPKTLGRHGVYVSLFRVRQGLVEGIDGVDIGEHIGAILPQLDEDHGDGMEEHLIINRVVRVRQPVAQARSA